MNDWDVSRVTVLFDIFKNDAANGVDFSTFNEDIDGWDVSGVTLMTTVFLDAFNFNSPLSSWNTAQVTFLDLAFRVDVNTPNGITFNQDIGSWNTAKVQKMSYALGYATEFNQDIGSWNTNKVDFMKGTFQGASKFNQDIDSWVTFHVTGFESTFQETFAFNQPLVHWPATNVETLKNTFWASGFNQNIDSWHTGKVTNMEGTFQSAVDFNQELGTWDTSQVTTLYGTFSDTFTFNQDLNGWDTGKVTSLLATFENADQFNSDLSKWDTGEVTTLVRTFFSADRFAANLSNWDVSKVTSLANTFMSAHHHAPTRSITMDLSKWDTSKVTSLKNIFRDTSYAQYGDINGWDVSQVTTMEGFVYDRREGLRSPLYSWDIGNVQNFLEFGTTDAFYNTIFSGFVPTVTMDLTAWTAPPQHVSVDYGSCKQYFPPPVNLIGEACGTTSTTTTITTTTVADCDAGKYLDTSANQCVNCQPGQYRIGTTGHAHEVLTSCRPHSACGPSESTLFEGTADMDAQCIAPSATTHCGADQFVDGAVSIYDGQWHLQCVAHTTVGSFDSTLCPWAGSTHANAGNTLLNVTISDPTSSHDPAADLTDDHKTLFNSFDELTRAENNKGHVWVRLCTPKIICLASNNEYVYSDGSETSNRVCRVCPRICGGVEYNQPASCPGQTLNPVLPRAECTVATGNNSAVCCRIAYDRSAYQQDIVDGECESNPFGETDATQTNLNHQCNGVVAIRSTISTTTVTTSTTTRTDTSATTSTTHLTMCNPGEFRSSATNLCENCPDGQFQPSVNFAGTSCRPHSICDPETEIELTAVDVIDARKHDTLCGTLQECPNGQYRVNYNDGTVESGSWKIDCRTLEALSGANACDQHPGSDLNITIFQNETTGGLVVQHDFEALRNVPLIHVCSFWTDCLASENQYIASDASTSSDRVCQQCPYLESNTEVQFDWTQHSCNMREADDGSYSTSAGYHGECMGVTRDNAHYCCRRGFDRKLFHFREATAEDCRIHALNEDDVGISHAWLANSILVPNPTTATTTTVTESKLTTTSTTPPETIDVSGDTVKIVAAGTSSTEEEAAGFAALGIGVAVIIGVCAVGIYQARKSSFSDRKLFHDERRKILFHVE